VTKKHVEVKRTIYNLEFKRILLVLCGQQTERDKMEGKSALEANDPHEMLVARTWVAQHRSWLAVVGF
jgi:hypothetical protein